MSNLKTSLKIAILAIVGLIMSIVAYSLTEFDAVLFVVYAFALAFVVSLTIFVGGFVNRNISNSKNVNAIILFLFGAVISFIMNYFLGDDVVFYYIGIFCVILLFVSIFVLIARKLFKNELKSMKKTASQEEAVNTEPDNDEGKA